ncbi:MAG: hypothetical protein U5K72_00265 [Balneolaceae bacterium]|nr:hypothetical protein [Balneolaceae bacterium]
MNSKRSHSQNILETSVSTVTSGGHWFHATRETIEDYVPGLLDKYDFEALIKKAVTWIDSADSLALILYFILAFLINPWIAAGIALGFHVFWYHKKSAFVNIVMTPILSFFNMDFFQLLLAALVLSYMGMSGMYTAVVLGIIFFFLFKVGLLRRGWDKLQDKISDEKLPLNDRVLKMVLIRYSIYQNMPPKEVEKLDRHVQDAVLKFNRKKK